MNHNHIGAYNPNDVHHSNMATTHAHPPSSGPMGGHYSQYPAPIMPSHSPYTAQYQSYAAYPPYSGAPVSTSMPHHNLVAMQTAPAQTLPGTTNYIGQSMDTTGQLAPPGVKPRVTATLWEDEGTLCFQVEAKGVCVARREDNHMINGTKLLNVAGMTRGRRDGILKSEKMRHVVKIGPMHLKGVWIPFERALDFANKEKITETLYPLFVQDIGALLYHPQNSGARAGAGMGGTQNALAAYERRRTEQRMGTMAPQTPSQTPAMHPLLGPVPNGSSAPRPGMDRTSTFPTPPTSASSVVVNPQGSPYEYPMPSNGQQLSIDTTISNQRSVPNTPASTPPGKVNHGSYSATQAYDPTRPVYSNVAPTGQYQQQQHRVHQFGGPLQPPPSYKKEDHEHQDYNHSSNGYAPSQSAYAYNPNSNVAGHPSPQQNDSGRVTPRTSTSQIYQYPTPQRSNTAPVSNVYNVVEPRDAANGHESHYYSATNGSGTKRAREDDDEVDDSKRQKVDPEEGGPVGGSPYTGINVSRPIANARKAR